VRDADLVISVSHCVAKSIKPPPDVPHICYCNTPMRYVWEQYGDYFGAGNVFAFAGLFAVVGAIAAAVMFRENRTEQRDSGSDENRSSDDQESIALDSL
jgi:hypothetical protein